MGITVNANGLFEVKVGNEPTRVFYEENQAKNFNDKLQKALNGRGVNRFSNMTLAELQAFIGNNTNPKAARDLAQKALYQRFPQALASNTAWTDLGNGYTSRFNPATGNYELKYKNKYVGKSYLNQEEINRLVNPKNGATPPAATAKPPAATATPPVATAKPPVATAKPPVASSAIYPTANGEEYAKMLEQNKGQSLGTQPNAPQVQGNTPAQGGTQPNTPQKNNVGKSSTLKGTGSKLKEIFKNGNLKKAGKIGGLLVGIGALVVGVAALFKGCKDDKVAVPPENKQETPVEPEKPTTPETPETPVVPPSLPLNENNEYEIKKGDTYWDIAERNLKDKFAAEGRTEAPTDAEIQKECERIMRLNKTWYDENHYLPDPMIHAGDVIKINPEAIKIAA